MKPICLSFAVAALAGAAAAETVRPPAPTTFAFEEVASLGPVQVIGDTPQGRRQAIPITGGTFSGPGISGQILPGGADQQLVRSDGSVMIDADYMLETDDHVKIHVRNVGIIVPPREGKPVYFWAVPTFQAPGGKYGWLNDAIFLSHVDIAGDKDHPAVRVTIYKVA